MKFAFFRKRQVFILKTKVISATKRIYLLRTK